MAVFCPLADNLQLVFISILSRYVASPEATSSDLDTSAFSLHRTTFSIRNCREVWRGSKLLIGGAQTVTDAEKIYSNNLTTSNLDRDNNSFAFNFLALNDEIAQFWHSLNWAATPIGIPETWSSSFRTAFQICLTSPLPMVLWWGETRSLLYNPASVALLGNQHPDGFGQAGDQGWTELWQQVGAVVDDIFATGQIYPQQTLNLYSHEQEKEYSFVAAHSSIANALGNIEAVLTILTPIPTPASLETLESQFVSAFQSIDDQNRVDVEYPNEYPDNHSNEYSDVRYQQLEAALRTSEARFKRLVETNFFGVAIGDYDGNMLYANDAFLSMIGYSREQLETGEISWIDITPAEYLSLDWHAGEELRQHGISQPFEKEYIHKDGHRVPVLIRSALLNEPNQQPEQIISFYLDLTNLKHTERTLQSALQRLNSHIENTPLAVVEWDRDMRVTRWSANAERMFGWRADEVMGKSFAEWQFVYEADLEHVKQSIQPLLTHDASQIVCFNRNYTKDGRVIYCEWYGSSLIDEQGGLSLLSLVLDVTERQQAEIALRESEQRFQLATRAIEGLVFDWDIQTGEVYRSEGLYRLIGMHPDAVPQTRDWWKERLHPDDIERLRRKMPELLNSNRDRYEGEYRIRHEQGHWVDVWERGFLLRNEAGQVIRIVGITSDITDRKQIEQEIRSLNQNLERRLSELQTLLNVVPVGISIAEDPQCRVIRANSFFQKIFNTKPSDNLSVQESSTPIVPVKRLRNGKELRSNELPMQVAAAQGIEVHNTEIQIIRPDGAAFDLLGSAVPLFDDRGEVRGSVAVFMDITERKQAELEREQILQRERSARQDAETANRIKDEFLAVLSHELRSPLNPILGWAKLLRSRKFDAATTDHALETIERNAKLQTQLIADLLDVSRILRGKMVLETAPVNLKTTVEAAIETVRLAAEAKNLHLQLVTDTLVADTLVADTQHAEAQSPECWVIGDAARLQQIVWNLLSNAVKFTPSEGRVEVRLERVDRGQGTVDRQNNNSPSTLHPPFTAYAQITVTDTGKGISPEFLPYVFEYFRQEDGSITRKFGGLGLGLAIVRHLTELHGGVVLVESLGEGMGATFRVQLPLLKTKVNRSNQIISSRTKSHAATLTGLRLLVVDDDADIRELIALILRQAGADVEVADSAIEALSLLQHTSPDILISDIGMPDMDGYHLIQQVRTLPVEQGGQIPAIALTAYAGERDQQQAIGAGFHQHIAKPVEPEELIAAVLAIKPFCQQP